MKRAFLVLLSFQVSSAFLSATPPSASVFVGANPRTARVSTSVFVSANYEADADGGSRTTTTKVCTFEYTHLEVNGMLWRVPDANVSLVVDPIASELNFGIPQLYRAKKTIGEKETLDKIIESKPTHCLLSQGLDDHTHLATLEKLCNFLPDLRFIVAPSARDKLASIVPLSKISVLEPGASTVLSPHAVLSATHGALVGPPWQARENGWLLNINQNDMTIYMEPHADVTDQDLVGVKADICILPVTQQDLPAQVPEAARFTLVYGGGRSLEIAETLGASIVIPLCNGELVTEGRLAGVVRATGNVLDFERLVSKRNANTMEAAIRVEIPTPGAALTVQLPWQN